MAVYLFKTEESYGGDTKIFLSEEEAEIYKLRYIAQKGGKVDCRVVIYHPFPKVKVKDQNGEFYMIGEDAHGNNAVLLELNTNDKWSLDNYPVSDIIQ